MTDVVAERPGSDRNPSKRTKSGAPTSKDCVRHGAAEGDFGMKRERHCGTLIRGAGPLSPDGKHILNERAILFGRIGDGLAE